LKSNEPENGYICVADNGYPRIVVIGAGFAGINFIKSLEGKPVQVILIDQNNYHQFQPLLYQVAISGLEPDSVVTPIRKLFKSRNNLIYRMAQVFQIDTDARIVETDIGRVTYDYLGIATGSSTNFYGSDSIQKNSIGLKSINDAINIRSWMLQNLEKAVEGCHPDEKSGLTKFVIVGGGPAGVEMAGALAEFKKYLLRNDYPEIVPESMQIYLIQSGERLLPMMSKRASRRALKVLEALEVSVLLESRVRHYDGLNVRVLTKGGDRTIPSATLIWTAGVMGNLIRGIDPTSIVPGNRIEVDPYNQVAGLKDVFAIGDVAAMISGDRPKGHPMVAQVAIQQGRTLAGNIDTKVRTGSFARPFLYVDKGSMATIGKKDAVADLKVAFLDGRVGWLLWSCTSSNEFRLA